MKKLILLSIISIGFNSCKKDRACVCKYADGSTASKSTYVNVTRKEARNLCTSSSSGITCAIE